LGEYKAVIIPIANASQTVKSDSKYHFLGLFLLASRDSDIELQAPRDTNKDAQKTMCRTGVQSQQNSHKKPYNDNAKAKKWRVVPALKCRTKV
jgi:hypothetical protein